MSSLPASTASALVPAAVELSVIVPIGPRHDEIKALHGEYRRGLESLGRSFELIYVVDGPDEEVSLSLDDLLRSGERLTVVLLTRLYGESTALMAGFESARGKTIVTLPAYRQIDMRDIGKLVEPLEVAEVVVCQRTPRMGGPLERLRRNVYHGLVAWMTGLRLHDLGCGARAMQRQVLAEIPLYGDQHRLLPALADRRGFRVREVEVRQSAQDRHLGGYRTREYAHRLLDIIAVFFLLRFTKKPLRFFGMVGASVLGVGAVLLLYLVVERLIFGQPLADRPALLLSSLLVVLGLQLVAIGLLAELIIFTHARDMKDYQVDRIIEFPGATPPSA